MFRVFYLNSVEEDLKKLDKPLRKRILDKIEKHLAKDPKNLGLALTGQFKGFWRYRVGDFRVIYRISQEEILILVARIGHRKSIYK